MHNQDDSSHKASTPELEPAAIQPQEKPAMAGSKMMLIFGGVMAVCCGLPLLLASGLSLAWFTESPLLAVVLAAAAAVFAWRSSGKGPACSHAKQDADRASAPAAAPEDRAGGQSMGG